MKSFLLSLSLLVLLACEKNTAKTMKPTDTLTYLAIGDSYTIGEAVPLSASFPHQLCHLLNAKGLGIATPRIIAKTGWTSAELQEGIRSSGVKEHFDLVTLLIGVNNQYRGESESKYREEFRNLLERAIQFAAGKKAHVFVISIPDWGATPYGQQSGRDTEVITAEINAFNAINKEETLAQGISYTDITPASGLAKSDGSLVASDGLHPSAKMYLEWAVQLEPKVLKGLK
ncbi:SGNH/GDSL hydrolase family protein [Pedobacter gandavensis]|uniref:SGNH/GDSL hydrolase family protein n=1 Tax=Pedobacter gandavensis TaxID=2679963 RepID=UPI002931CB66|nr:SGNH/GDSL hydrolase family protein [Pedobacter gandavensis]